MIALLLSFALILQGIPVPTQQAGTVSGILKDTQGKPVAGIRMAAIARPASLDEAVTSAAMSSLAETDEQGRYTLESIPPGRYYIAAGRLDAQTFYPGTGDMATAKEVAITPGSVISGIDFTLGDSSFGRAGTGISLITATIPMRVTVDGGSKMPVSANGKFTSVKFDMSGSVITTPISSATVTVQGPQTTAYRVTVENLPETYVVKSMMYGTTDILTNTLRLTPANFLGSAAGFVQQISGVLTPLPQSPAAQQAFLAGLAAGQAAAAGVPGTTIPLIYVVSPAPATTPPSLLSITLVPVAPRPTVGARVSGRMSGAGARTVFLSGIPGTVYSDGTFEIVGVPSGRHSIVTRDNPSGSRPLAASVVIGSGNLEDVLLAETAILPFRAWEPSAPRPSDGRPAGTVPLPRLTGTLVEELTKNPIPEGTVFIRTNGYASVSFPVDTDGHFELPPLLPGIYDLEVQIFGHSNIKQSIEIGDKDMKLDLISRKLY